MKNRIAWDISLICIVAVLLVFGLGILVTQNINFNVAKENAVDLAEKASASYNGDNSIVNTVLDGYRLTIIDDAGKVLADSDYENVDGMDNHLTREEIVAALSGAPATVQRKSETTGNEMIYYAVKKDFGGSYVFIRAAANINGVNAYVAKSVPLMVGISAFTILCAVLCSIFLASRLVRPLKELRTGLVGIKNGKYQKVYPTSADVEVNEIIGDINDVAETLDNAFYRLKNERENLNGIVDTIADGIVLLAEGDVVLVNAAAKQMFCCTDAIVGKNVAALTENKTICTALNEAKETTFECEVNAKTLVCSVKNVAENTVLVVFSDVTAQRNSQKIRSEFFSNAGHELKTPLTAIVGFNEIIEQNDKDGALSKYTSQIKSNSARMLSLVNDMLKLSKLESETKQLSAQKIKGRKVALQVKDDLRLLAEQRNTSVEINGDATFNLSEQNLYELIKNVVENGIKYGRDGGFVKVKLSETPEKAVVEISDDGIGIDEKDQGRIFERFYRVEKSRSRATGGTGLGLAIVKHIVLNENGEIALKSKLGIGTTLTATFPKPTL